MRGGHVQELENWDPDILLLQEIKLREPDPETNMKRKNDLKGPLETLQKRFGYRRCNCGCSETALHGTAVLSKYTPDRVSTELGDRELDDEGRTQLIEFRTFGILNSYVPFQGLDDGNIQKTSALPAPGGSPDTPMAKRRKHEAQTASVDRRPKRHRAN
jgi:exonuclease III